MNTTENDYCLAQQDLLELQTRLNDKIEKNENDYTALVARLHSIRTTFNSIGESLTQLKSLSRDLKSAFDSDSIILDNTKRLTDTLFDAATNNDDNNVVSTNVAAPAIIDGALKLRALNTLLNMGELLNIDSVKEFKYEIELDQLLTRRAPPIVNEHNFALNRLDCAAVVAKVLLTPSLTDSKLSFEKIKTGTRPAMRAKLKALVEYVATICALMRSDTKNILQSKVYASKTLVQTPKIEMVVESETIVDTNRVTIKRFDRDYNFAETTSEDVIGLYLVSDFNESPTTESLNDADVQFFRFPELFAVLQHLKLTNDRGDETCFIGNLIQYNFMRHAAPMLEYMYNAFEYDAGINYVNFTLIFSNDLSLHPASNENDVDHLNREINRLAANLCEYNKSADNDSDDDSTFFAGPFGETRNRVFQFLIELLVTSACGYRMFYRAGADAETETQIEQALMAIGDAKLSAAKLYTKLVNYNFRVEAYENFV